MILLVIFLMVCQVLPNSNAQIFSLYTHVPMLRYLQSHFLGMFSCSIDKNYFYSCQWSLTDQCQFWFSWICPFYPSLIISNLSVRIFNLCPSSNRTILSCFMTTIPVIIADLPNSNSRWYLIFDSRLIWLIIYSPFWFGWSFSNIII